MSPSRLATAATLVFLACAPPPQPAPAALDANVEWFWVHADSESDSVIADSAATLAVAGKAATRTTKDPLKARSRVTLTADELAPVNLTTNDPSTAKGLLAVDVFPCTLDKLESILSDPEQATLYPSTWDTYVRTMKGDRAAFLAKTAATVSWDAEVDITFPVADSYTSTMKGSLRRVHPPAGQVPSDLILARTWLAEPAHFLTASSTSYVKQDYEIEIFWEQTPGTIFHAYGMWRDVKVGGFNYTLADDNFFTIVVNNLVDWDNKTAAICARP
jgi:hypothetical protein